MKQFLNKNLPWLKIILIAIIFLNVLTVVWSQRATYFTFNYWQRFPKLKQTYLNSQYATKHAVWIRDEVAYAYAGGALIRGENPIYVIPDAPPLGKYLIGISAVLFNNEHMISLICGVLSLYLLYLLSKQVIGSSFYALFPPLFYSFEILFKNQFVFTPLFDTMQLVFLLLLFYVFNKGLMTKKYLPFFVLTNLLLGCFIATKFFVSGITIVAACVAVLLLRRNWRALGAYVITLPLALIVLLFTYVWVFAYGYHFREFLGIQKWIFLYHKGQLGHAFSIWPLLFLNKWHVWFGNVPILSDSQWRLSWPIITIGSFITGILYLGKKIKPHIEVEVLLAWIVSYLLFFSIGEITTRYFIILLPILYLVTIFGILKFSKAKKL